jgi:integrase
MASFRKHENGTWEYRIRYKDPLTGKYKEKSKRGFKTKKEAQLAAMKTEQEIQSNPINTDNLTFNSVFEEWWASHSKTIKQSTQHNLKSKFKRILDYFGNAKIKDISKQHCQHFIDELAKQLKSANDYKIQANQVFKYALKMDYISHNPMEHVIVPKKEEEFLVHETPKRNFWNKEEVKNFLSQLQNEDPQDFIMFYLLIYTGMRKGELLALEWEDINFQNKTVLINKTIFFKDNQEILQKVKNYQARTISLDSQTVKYLQKWRVQQREKLLWHGYTQTPKNVLTRPDMRPLRLAYPNDRLASLIKKYNMHRITVHGLRHTHASILFEAGVSIKEVQARLGHRDIKTTMDIYTHVTDIVKEKTADTFHRYIESN